MHQSSTESTSTRDPIGSGYEEFSDEGAINLQNLLQALRRRWLLIIVAGIPTAGVVAGLLWWAIPHRYEAVAELLVRSQEDRLLPSLDSRSTARYVASEYDIYRQTQA